MKDTTDITVVLDRSGSMRSHKPRTIEGFNKFLAAQQAENGFATMSLVQFNHHYQPVYQGTQIQYCQPITNGSYVTEGDTALLDAMGQAMQETFLRWQSFSDDERPEKVIFVVITDGEENASDASRGFSAENLKTNIQMYENVYNWEFIFLGADIDAFACANGLGVTPGKTAKFNKDKIVDTFETISRGVSTYRNSAPGEKIGEFFSEADRKKIS